MQRPCSALQSNNLHRHPLHKPQPTSFSLHRLLSFKTWKQFWTVDITKMPLLLPMLSLSSTIPTQSTYPSLQFRRRNRFSTRRSVRCSAIIGGESDAFTAKSGYLFELSAKEADSLAEYSISKIAAIYYRKPLLVARRLVQTGLAFGKWFGLRYLDALFDRSDDMFQVSKLFLIRNPWGFEAEYILLHNHNNFLNFVSQFFLKWDIVTVVALYLNGRRINSLFSKFRVWGF